MTANRALLIAALPAALFGGCAPTSDDPGYRDVPGMPDGDDGRAGTDDAPSDDGPVESDVDREVPDFGWDAVCDAEDLPLEYDVDSDVLIVLDRSGSMAMTLPALKNAVNAIVVASDDRIWFGLMPFPSSVPPNECRLVAPATECAAPATAHVPLGPNRAPEIAAALAPLRICGSTPTAATLRRAREYLRSAGTGHTKYVLLATDGVPNCNSTLDGATCTCLDTETGCAGRPEACLDDTAAYQALDDLLADGVRTYVLGMGSWMGGDRDLMNRMAEHGGTGRFYPAEDPSRILAAFEEIMGTIVVSCRFDLSPGPEADPTQVNLHVGGEVIPRDPSHTNGWDYVDEDTVEFYGPVCDAILSGDVSAVSASYGCPTVVL